ncbi:glycosyltransferase, partial [Nocardioides sp. GCM10030258]|uniref:glycosyltransferase n=3 Tax=Nocardioides TaxID=1839 RepID=UPI0036175DAA
AVPALAAHPAVAVVPNVIDLGGYDRAKDEDARFTLALIGISAVAKDVRWAIDVVRRLHAHDERYRLLLFGDDLANTGSAIGRAYDAGYFADLNELEPRGVVERRGYTNDVPGALREVGVILSSSVRESAHLVVVEGAASGAVPVVRDWP